MRKISKWKKFRRVFKRKLLKPLLYAAGASLLLYLLISNAIIQKRIAEPQTPQFVISRISDQFDETEFMHMLLTIQELRNLPEEGRELRQFVNQPFPSACPKLLAHRLNQMNWAPQAFLIRVKKMFKMYDIYDRIIRLDETIAFLSEEIDNDRLPLRLASQIKVLKEERDNIFNKEITKAEYDFMQTYGGIVIRLRDPAE